MSVSLSVERDRIQRQVEELEQSLSATYADLELLSSETGDESDDDSEEETGQSAAGLLAQREQIQKEIQNLENVLGPHSPDDDDSSSSEESELGLSPSADSCLQMNLVYQQVVQETLGQLETLLTVNHRQQKELVSQLSGPIKESSRERPASSSCQQPINMYLGRFLKPYFKDNLTGLGPPANQETKEKASRMTGCLDDQKLKVKRWESWQKTLLIHAVTRDSLRRLVQPKLSKVDYLSQKLSRAVEADRQQLRQQIDSLEREIDLLRRRTEKELIGGDRFDEHDWQKIANVDFEGTRDAEDIRSFWQNFLHPSIRKTQWSQEEVQRLKEISRRHGDRHWEDIAAELGTGRTAFLCLQTFQRFVSDSLKRGSWTPVEDFLLRELVDKMRIGNFIPYTQMSYFMEGRDPAQLIYRWNQVLDPSLKKGFWTKEEDLLLLQAVSRYGEKDWCKIRFEVPGRTDSSCRDRYYDCLKAETRRGPFDQQERQLLLMLVKKHGVGRWAKIAAEIPDRYDAQCLREWRKLSKQAPPPRAKKDKTTRNDPTSGGGAKKKRRRRKKASPARKSIKRRLMELKEEESSEDDGMVVVYMDSDEEETKKKKKEVVEVEKEKEEEEEEYTFPPMQEWIPIEEAQSFTFLNFRPVELFSSGVAHNHERVRSTILGQFGRSVIVGPSPRELQWAERHSSSTMMMVSPDQLRAHLYRQVQNFNNRSSSRRKKIQIDKRSPLGRVTDIGLGYELQAAVTPWIGNLLIPPKHRLTTADSLRERGEKTRLPSTPVFLLLLQTLNVDSLGCKEMIEQRKKRVVSLAPPPPPRPSSVHKNTVAGMLQQRKAVKEETQMFDQQHKLILKQLQALQQQQKQKQQPLLLSVHPLPPHPPSNHPSVLLQMPPNMHRWMSPMSFPQAVFIPHPVTQPHASSIQSPSSLNTPPPAPHRPPPVGVDTSPRRLSVPPVSGVPVPLNATSTCSASSRQEAAAPLTQSLPVALPPSPNRQGGGDGDGGGCTGEDGAGDGDGDGDGMVAEGRRIRKPSQKAKALQEATEAKAGAKKKAAPSPRKRTPIQTSVPVPPQTSVPVPPQTSVPVPPQTSVPVPPQTSVPVPPQTSVPVPPQTSVPVPPQTSVPVPPQTSVPVPPQTSVPVPPQTSVPVPPQTSVPVPPQTSVPVPPQTSVPVPPQTSVPVPPQTSVPVPPQTSVPVPPQTSVPVPPQTSVPVPPQTSVPVPPQTSVPVPPQTSVPVPPQTSVPVPPQNPSLRLNILPVSVNSSPLPLNATLACSDRNVSSTLVPPPSIPTNQHLASSTSSRPAPFSNDHDYTSFNLQPGQRGSNSTQLTTDSASNQPSKAPRSRRRKRGRGEEHPGVTSSQDDQCVGGTGDAVDKTDTGAIQEGKRVRQPTERLRALQEATQAKAEAKKKRASPSSPRRKRSCPSRPKKEVVVQDQPVTQPSGFCLLPGQSMWVMTPGGLVQLAMVPSAPLPAPPPTAVSVPVNLPVMNQPRPFPVPPTCASKPLPPAFILHPVSKPGSSPLPSCPPQPPSKFFLPYKGTVRVDPAAPPPLRREALQFDPSLMFLESQGAVRDWLSGRGGVVVPGLDVALPYLPPFVSSLSTLSALLRAKKSLTTSSLQLLSRGSEPQRHPTTAKSDSSTERTSSPHPDLPDSTSDLRPAQDTPAPSVNPDLLQEEEEEEEEAELVVVARQLVAERFSGNPAYQLLKARFLSCFTVPALMATVQPIREKTEAGPANEEEEKEEEEEEELKKIQERGRRRRVERSLLLCDDGSGAPAGHFSGIITNTTGPERSGAVGTGAERSGRERSGRNRSGAVGTGAERSGAVGTGAER